MAAITFTGETLQQMSLFRNVTKTSAIDCLESETKVLFVVKEGEIGPAVGKGGQNVNRLRQALHKEVQVVEHSEDPTRFIKNIFRNYGVREVTFEDRGESRHASVQVDPLRKGRAIGKEGTNLRLARELISRHHDVQSVVIA
ncbi:MAG: NusA-like transcription termination signal-binding factor [Thermoplasmata archaeon]|nr:NusA-like transcription termination signal-binding factor [Thermoplasmata archaeon]